VTEELLSMTGEIAAREALRALLVQGGAGLRSDLALHELVDQRDETLA